MQFRAMNPEPQGIDLVTAGQGGTGLFAFRNPVPFCPECKAILNSEDAVEKMEKFSRFFVPYPLSS